MSEGNEAGLPESVTKILRDTIKLWRHWLVDVISIFRLHEPFTDDPRIDVQPTD